MTRNVNIQQLIEVGRHPKNSPVRHYAESQASSWRLHLLTPIQTPFRFIRPPAASVYAVKRVN